MSSFVIGNKTPTYDERQALRAKADQLNERVRDNWHVDSFRRELAQEMFETIYRGFEHENLLGLMTDVVNAGFTERVFIKEVRGLRCYWVARGGYIDQSTVHTEVMEVPRDTIAFHVSEFEDKLQMNFSETQAGIVDLATQRMDAQINQRLTALYQTGVPSSSPYYISGAGLSLTTLNTALRAVRDESRSFDVSIIGRITMTDQIIEKLVASGTSGTAAGFTPETNEEMLQRGVLGTYRGARIITLRNYADDQNLPYFPANELYIVGSDASRFVFFGPMKAKEWVEEDNWYWHSVARRDVGTVLHRPSRLRRIVDTSIAASTPLAS